MKVLAILWNIVCRAYYAWAMYDINKTHPDVPKIIIKRQMLEDERRRLCPDW